MRIFLSGVALMLVLVGCSRSADPAAEGSAVPEGSSAQASDAPVMQSRGEKLTGEVSSLKGDVSDLRVRITDTATIVELSADVLFAFDSAELSSGAASVLAKAADLIRQGISGKIGVVGHTDSKGTPAYNVDLSKRRAASVAEWFAKNAGIEASRFETSGAGEDKPVAPNAMPDGSDNPEGRAQNRRVEIAIPR